MAREAHMRAAVSRFVVGLLTWQIGRAPKGNHFSGAFVISFRECNYLVLKVVFASGIVKPC